MCIKTNTEFPIKTAIETALVQEPMSNKIWHYTRQGFKVQYAPLCAVFPQNVGDHS